MMKPPYNPIDVANYIVAEAVKREQPVTHLKLQKILYYVVAKYLQYTQKSLINEPVLKWQYGPVVKSVYHAFKNYGSYTIDQAYIYLTDESSLTPDENGRFKLVFADPVQIHQNLGENPNFVSVVTDVLDSLIQEDAFALVEKTHQEPAWADYKDQIFMRGADLEYTHDELQRAIL